MKISKAKLFHQHISDIEFAFWIAIEIFGIFLFEILIDRQVFCITILGVSLRIYFAKSGGKK